MHWMWDGILINVVILNFLLSMLMNDFWKLSIFGEYMDKNLLARFCGFFCVYVVMEAVSRQHMTAPIFASKRLRQLHSAISVKYSTFHLQTFWYITVLTVKRTCVYVFFCFCISLFFASWLHLCICLTAYLFSATALILIFVLTFLSHPLHFMECQWCDIYWKFNNFVNCFWKSDAWLLISAVLIKILGNLRVYALCVCVYSILCVQIQWENWVIPVPVAVFSTSPTTTSSSLKLFSARKRNSCRNYFPATTWYFKHISALDCLPFVISPVTSLTLSVSKQRSFAVVVMETCSWCAACQALANISCST